MSCPSMTPLHASAWRRQYGSFSTIPRDARLAVGAAEGSLAGGAGGRPLALEDAPTRGARAVEEAAALAGGAGAALASAAAMGVATAGGGASAAVARRP